MKDEELYQAIKDSIAHWRRMHLWAAKQPRTAGKTLDEITQTIGEGWTGESCPLCQLILYSRCEECSCCPLPKCDNIRYDTPWSDASKAYTWSEFADAAAEMICLLETILMEAERDEQEDNGNNK